MGREFGATTGRARRCGWFDAVSTRFAAMVNGIDEIAITNLDGLDTVKTIKVCVGYKLDGQDVEVPPSDYQRLAACEPVYIELPGWNTPTDQFKTFAELPENAQSYALKIAELTGGKLTIVSVGANRDQTILL